MHRLHRATLAGVAHQRPRRPHLTGDAFGWIGLPPCSPHAREPVLPVLDTDTSGGGRGSLASLRAIAFMLPTVEPVATALATKRTHRSRAVNAYLSLYVRMPEAFRRCVPGTVCVQSSLSRSPPASSEQPRRSCGSVGQGPGCPRQWIPSQGYPVSAWSISVKNTTCAAAHSALATGIVWRFATPRWNPDNSGVPPDGPRQAGRCTATRRPMVGERGGLRPELPCDSHVVAHQPG
jgi:hypothetical protein